MSNYAFGDLQGCYKEFKTLLEQINFNPSRDTLWICGDLVNRGPESLNCLTYIHSIKDSCRIVLGNHDLHLIAVCESVRDVSDSDTFEDILKSPKKEMLIKWLKSLPFQSTQKIKTEKGELEFVMTHAGVPPHWSKSQLIENSEELSEHLRSENPKNFLKSVFGDTPNHPDRCKTDQERMRLNLNYLTRMRFYNSDGSLDLSYKGKIDMAPPELKPWFKYKLRILEKDTQLLFGHWAALDGVTDQEQITALDTGCAWGNKLTTVRLEDNSVFSCDKLN
tara:strand:- start:3458 stop:4291 length:834 start_codon:yes stop_codon:yes gene_type:complete